MRPIILAVRKGALTSLVNGLLAPFDPTHPDARVIAASADLLAVLESLMDKYIESGEICLEDFDQAKAVINLTKGQS